MRPPHFIVASFSFLGALARSPTFEMGGLNFVFSPLSGTISASSGALGVNISMGFVTEVDQYGDPVGNYGPNSYQHRYGVKTP